MKRIILLLLALFYIISFKSLYADENDNYYVNCGNVNGIPTLELNSDNEGLCKNGTSTGFLVNEEKFSWGCEGYNESDAFDTIICSAPRQYKVTIYLNGGIIHTNEDEDIELKVPYGEKILNTEISYNVGTGVIINKLQVPYKKGYSFKGWYYGEGKRIYKDYIITGDTYINAVYTICGMGIWKSSTLPPTIDLCDFGTSSDITTKNENFTWICSNNNVIEECSSIRQYTITIDSNGGIYQKTGTGILKKQTLNYNSIIGTLPSPGYSTGYTFTGWYTEKDGGSLITSITPVTGDMTIYANWKKTINGICGSAAGSGTILPPTKDLCKEGTASNVTLSSTYNKYLWTCKGNISKNHYTNCSAPRSFKVIYNQNYSGSTEPIIKDLDYTSKDGKTYYLKFGEAPILSREGYKFLGWWNLYMRSNRSEIKKGSIIVTDEYGIKKGSITLQALWKKKEDGVCGIYSENKEELCKTGNASKVSLIGKNNYSWNCAGNNGGKQVLCSETKQYTIYFLNPNGDKPSFSSKKVNYNSIIGDFPTVSKDGYTFNGWFTERNKGKEIDKEYIIKGSIELYAQWKKEKIINEKITGSQNKGITQTGSENNSQTGNQNSLDSQEITDWEYGITIKNNSEKVNGACGSANGTITNIGPEVNLCKSGNFSSLKNNYKDFTWTCSGYNGGKSVNCSAIRQYIIIFNSNGYRLNFDTKKVNYGDAIGELPNINNKSGYVFDGWYAGKIKIDERTIINDEILENSKGDLNGYIYIDASWKGNNEIDNTSENLNTKTNGSCGSANLVPTREQPSENLCISGTASGFETNTNTFYWYCNGTNGGTKISCSAPRINSTDNNTNTNINNNYNNDIIGTCGTLDGASVVSVDQNKLCSVGTYSGLTSDFYDFHWYCGINKCSAKRQYIIMFNSLSYLKYDGVQIKKLYYDNLISLPKATYTGTGNYSLDGWYTEGGIKITDNTKLNKDLIKTNYTYLTLYPKLKENKINSDELNNNNSTSNTDNINGVCGSLNGGSYILIDKNKLCSVGTYSELTSDFYIFYWYCKGVNQGETVKCSAKKQYSIIFNSTSNVTYEGNQTLKLQYDDLIPLPKASYNGTGSYTFDGWYTEGGIKINENTKLNNALIKTNSYYLSLYPRIKKVSTTESNNSYCGTSNGVETYYPYNLCGAGESTGFKSELDKFTWTCTYQNITQNCSAPRKYYLNYEIEYGSYNKLGVFDIKSVSSGDFASNIYYTNIKPNNKFLNSPIVKTADSYIFDGWYTEKKGDGIKIDTNTVFNDSKYIDDINYINLYANFKEKNSDLVCSDKNGKSSNVTPSNDLCKEGTPSTVIVNNENYTWSCKLDSGDEYKCSVIRSYVVNFKANLGTNTNITTRFYNYNSTIRNIPIITRDGYEFIGRFDKEGREIDKDTKITGNITFYAEFAKIVQ